MNAIVSLPPYVAETVRVQAEKQGKTVAEWIVDFFCREVQCTREPEAPRNPEGWLSVREAAGFLRLSEKTVRKFVSEGSFGPDGAKRFGGRIYINAAAISPKANPGAI